jgi:hypothetical protein
MTLEQASFLAQIVSAVAVIASIIFLAMQIRTATRAVRASTSQAHSALYHAIVVTLVDNGEFASIWRRALADFDSCSLDERVRFVAQASALFRYYESSRVQWLHGQLDQEHWFTIERQAMSLAAQPGIKSWWILRRHWHSDDFQHWFDDLEPAPRGLLYGTEDSVQD